MSSQAFQCLEKDGDGEEIGWLDTVFEAGTAPVGAAIMAVIFGAWLGQLMNKTGVTETIIKKSAGFLVAIVPW